MNEARVKFSAFNSCDVIFFFAFALIRLEYFYPSYMDISIDMFLRSFGAYLG